MEGAVALPTLSEGQILRLLYLEQMSPLSKPPYGYDTRPDINVNTAAEARQYLCLRLPRLLLDYRWFHSQSSCHSPNQRAGQLYAPADWLLQNKRHWCTNDVITSPEVVQRSH